MNSSVSQKIAISPNVLHHVYNIPQLFAPTSQSGRTEWLQRCRETPHQVVASLEQYRDQLGAGENTFDGPGQPSIWNNFTFEEANRLLARDYRIILAVVEGAVRLRPLPSKTVSAQFKRLVRSASNTPYWSAFAIELVSAWYAEFFSSISDYDSRAEYHIREEARIEIAKRWPSAAHRAIEWVGRPLGENTSTDIDVDRWLLDALNSLTNN